MTATVIPTPTRINNQVQGQFYPLQREELIALRKNRLINNVAFVHLALRYENPYCDRPIEIIPKEFAEHWLLPESSIYEALGKLKRLGVLALKTGRVLLQWLSPDATKEEIQNIEDNLESQITSEEIEPILDSQKNSEIPEKILESQNQFQKPRIDSEIPEKLELEPLPQKDFEPPKTVITIQTQSEGRRQEAGGKRKEGEGYTDLGKNIKNQPPALCPLPPAFKRDEIVDKLEEAGIPVDNDVSEAVRSHHVSQVMKAIAIIASRDDISYPKGYFLKIVKQQPIENLGTRGEVFTADQAQGYTLEHLKNMYPKTWREAAAYFGIADAAPADSRQENDRGLGCKENVRQPDTNQKTEGPKHDHDEVEHKRDDFNSSHG